MAVSVQVLGEFYSQLTRQSRPFALGHSEAVAIMQRVLPRNVHSLTPTTVDMALQYRQRFGLSYWDCLILAAATQSGCDAVYSEDMSADQDYDGIRVINPFALDSERTPV